MARPKSYVEKGSCKSCRFVFSYVEFRGGSLKMVCRHDKPDDLRVPEHDLSDLTLFSCVMSKVDWKKWRKFAKENRVKDNGVCECYFELGV